MWRSAFVPTAHADDSFSGSLPILDINDEEISRVYYMSLLTLMTTSRKNLVLASQVFVTAQG